MLKWLKSLFQKTDDPTAYNCEVFIHKPSGELYVLNAKGDLEGDKEMLTIGKEIVDGTFDVEKNTLSVYIDRDKFEYLGDL